MRIYLNEDEIRTYKYNGDLKVGSEVLEYYGKYLEGVETDYYEVPIYIRKSDNKLFKIRTDGEGDMPYYKKCNLEDGDFGCIIECTPRIIEQTIFDDID